MSITKLKDRQLYTVCDPQKFDFASTAELEERMSALGQDRAISAVKLGINIKSKGYNLFCLGPEGTGKTSLVKRILEEAAKTRPTPRDWVYVYNFDEPYKPKSISFPAGTACEFAKDIDRLAEDFSVAIPAVLDSDEYKAGVSIIREKYKQKKEEYMRILQKKAKGKSVSLLHMQVGLVVAPVKNGEVLSPEAFDELPENEKQELINDLNLMQEEIEKAAKDLPEWEDRQRRESSLLREKFIKLAVKNPIDSLRQKYKGHREAIEFLKNIQNHIVGNIDEFLPEENAAPAEESDALSALLSRMNKQEEDKFAKFKVNVVVKNEKNSGAPIVHLDHPTQAMADMLHIIHHFGGVENLKGKKIAMTWAYSPSYGKPLSVPQGVIGLMSRFGMDVVLAHPEGYEVMPEVEEVAKANAAKTGGSFTKTNSMAEAFKDADIVYPKSWAPFAAMEKRTNLYAEGDADGIKALEKELLAQNADHKDWCCTEELMKTTKDGKALYLHCLPADINDVSCKDGEVEASVFDRYRTPLYKEASYKPYIIAAMIFLAKVKDPQATLKALEERGIARWFQK